MRAVFPDSVVSFASFFSMYSLILSSLFSISALAASAPPRSDGRCGVSFGGATCDPKGTYGGCCSQYGWCGSTAAYCSPSKNCQSGCTGSGASSSSKSSSSLKSTSKTTTSSSLKVTSTKSSISTKIATTPTSAAAPAYTLEAAYDATNWFSSFTAQALGTNDPTKGFVNYLSDAQAQAAGIYKIINNQIFIGVDNTSTLDPNGPGRGSVRTASNAVFNTGVFILDLAHMPSSVCSTWPAYWMLGTGTWPSTGEIDIIEGISRNKKNQMTLHTSPGCVIDVGPGGQTGTSGSASDCGANGGYNGCTVIASSTSTYGTTFNTNNGGVWAMHWNASEVKMWFFSHLNTIPSDITSGSPTPSKWGVPQANFGGCNFGQYMSDPMNIIFNIDFCGAWTNGAWNSGCAAATNQSSCNAYAAANPQAFSQTYWLINSLKIYNR